MIQTINGIDLLILIIGIAVGTRFGITIQRAREYEKELNHRDDFQLWLDGQQIENQMRRDGWKL
jgi:hypothetical protein